MNFLGGTVVKNLPANTGHAGDLGSIPWLGRSPGGGNGNPLQNSGLENSMVCVVHGVTKNRTQLSDFTFTFILVLNILVSKMVSLY